MAWLFAVTKQELTPPSLPTGLTAPLRTPCPPLSTLASTRPRQHPVQKEGGAAALHEHSDPEQAKKEILDSSKNQDGHTPSSSSKRSGRWSTAAGFWGCTLQTPPLVNLASLAKRVQQCLYLFGANEVQLCPRPFSPPWGEHPDQQHEDGVDDSR